MIPQKPKTFSPNSLEDIMFESLALLADDYFVFHSFRIVTVEDGVLRESETDFVIFHKKKGILSIEAKAGRVYYEDGEWYYGSGNKMSHDGPFNQASANKWKLKNYILHSPQKNLLQKCKLLHAVWFPSLSDAALRNLELPPEGDRNLILTESALGDPEPFISSIFETELVNGIETDLNDLESKRLLDNILCPAFDVFPTVSLDIDIKRITFQRLLKEQIGLLNYLEDQKSAVISGTAGTGKTMIAVEKAKRHASQGEKVLFLCFNNLLKNYLSENYAHDNISFYTIDGLACKVCYSALPDYMRFRNLLEDQFFAGNFEFKHIIIDEGQDFGQIKIEESDIIQFLQDIVLNEDINGTFYIFYDKLQLVQGKQIPKYISEADCKLTLYKNCRNTENIAITSMRPLTEKNPIVFEGSVKGATPKLHFCDFATPINIKIDSIIEKLHSEGIKDIVILTCQTEESSMLYSLCHDGYYKKEIKFTTCRKFKGLEADSVILIDVIKETFSEENVQLYYVGASRARFNLDIVSYMTDVECIDVLIKHFRKNIVPRKPKRDFATALNTLYEKNKQ